METKEPKKAIFLLRHDTTANWNASKLVLQSGEPGVEITVDGNRKVKIGDGINVWNDLNYIAYSQNELDSLLKNKTTVQIVQWGADD